MTNNSTLIQTLFSGDIDIIGDIHGEIGALYALLDRMGYNADGYHKLGRKLVFVGDLVDRGPDSVAVCSLVKNMWDKGNAQVVMGNHELNILRRKVEAYNAWYHGSEQLKNALLISDTEDAQSNSHVSFQRSYPPYTHDWIRDFFLQIPIALEREDLRVVHACWSQEAVKALKSGEQNPIKRYELEQEKYKSLFVPSSKDSNIQKNERDLFIQNNNPIKMITSGLEIMGEKFIVHSTPRYTHRKQWWKDYKASQKVIFGHYWRRRTHVKQPPYSFDVRRTPPPYLFENIEKYAWLGNTFCIDYSVGARYMERGTGRSPGSFNSYLCAMRVTGRSFELLFDDGLKQKI